MDNYLDIKLQPDAEMPVNRLLNLVFTKFHKSLWDIKSTGVGISFPNYKVTLGNILRLHASEDDLAIFQSKTWLGSMAGYCTVSDVMPVPKSVQYRTVSRKQSNMSQSKFNRLIRRGSITEAEAKAYKAKMFAKGLNEAYLELVSGSNGLKHRRYIQFGDLLEKPILGQFDQFGLSKTATVPWF
jgi:CRISPR-associated endonuclease Csy4